MKLQVGWGLGSLFADLGLGRDNKEIGLRMYGLGCHLPGESHLTC